MTANRQPDMFANAPDLFDPAPPQSERLPPIARRRLHALLADARAASRMPWDEPQASVNALLFHNMANWLPPPERDALRAAFTDELARLRAAG